MNSVRAASHTASVKHWFRSTDHPHILHVFDNACNLINEQKEVLSIVGPHIGNGPFNLVLEDEVLFSQHLSTGSQIKMLDDQLVIGTLRINLTNSKSWDPIPDWGKLHREKEKILSTFRSLSMPDHQPSVPAVLLSAFSSALTRVDSAACITAAKKLAGLGNGLTPAGDDIMMGALHAMWIIHPPDIAASFGKQIAETAGPLTTSLSAAWLRSAGRGEAGILWHQLFDALISVDRTGSLTYAMNKILCVGETSGADALAGFIQVLALYNK